MSPSPGRVVESSGRPTIAVVSVALAAMLIAGCSSGGPGRGGSGGGGKQQITAVNLNTNGSSPGGATTAAVAAATEAFLNSPDPTRRTTVQLAFTDNRSRQTWSNPGRCRPDIAVGQTDDYLRRLGGDGAEGIAPSSTTSSRSTAPRRPRSRSRSSSADTTSPATSPTTATTSVGPRRSSAPSPPRPR